MSASRSSDSFSVEDHEIIVGIHSILMALQNSQRNHVKIVATDDGLRELKKKYQQQTQKNLKELRVKIDILSSHALQESAKTIYQTMGLEFSRVPSGLYLITSKLMTYDLQEFLGLNLKRVLALDQISDVHNGAAILRTASFYGVEAILLPQEKTFGLTPSFYRIASGAVESVKLVRVKSLSRAISMLNDSGYVTIALSEHAENPFKVDQKNNENQKTCLLLGAEETGLSHAVLRQAQTHIRLVAQGKTLSLNVSAAAAIAMEKCFGI